MSHCDPEVLALLALGEGSDADGTDAANAAERRHVDACALCGGEVDHLRSVVAVARASCSADAPQSPSPRVWEAIAAELGLSGGAPVSVGASAVGDGAAEQPALPQPLATPTPTRAATGRSPRAWWALAAAVGGIGIGIAGTLLSLTGGESQVLASGTLDAFPTWQATGNAEVIDEHGSRLLRVELNAEDGAKPAGYREVWLIDANGTQLVPLGVLTGDTGTFAIPEGVELSDYPLVDISLEPYDGNPAHSGDSIVRGSVEA